METSTRHVRNSRSSSPVRTRERYLKRSRSPSPSGSQLERERERRRRRLRQLRADRELDHDDDYSPRHTYMSRNRNFMNDAYMERDAYSFLLSRHIKSSWSRDSTLGPISDTSEPDSTPAPQATTNPQLGKVLCVSESQYTGDGSIGGLQSAVLKVIGDETEGFRKGSQPVFRWM